MNPFKKTRVLIAGSKMLLVLNIGYIQLPIGGPNHSVNITNYKCGNFA